MKEWVIIALSIMLLPLAFWGAFRTAEFITNDVIFAYPTKSNLDFAGRAILINTLDGLVLDTYDQQSKPSRTNIPNSTGAEPSSLVTKDGTVLFAKLNKPLNLYEVWRYDGAATTRIVSLPMLDLPAYAKAYESGTAPSIQSVQGHTVYVYTGPFTLHSDGTFSFLELMPVEGDGAKLTKIALNRRVYSLDGNLVNVQRERETKSFDVSETKVYPTFIFEDLTLYYRSSISPSRLSREFVEALPIDVDQIDEYGTVESIRSWIFGYTSVTLSALFANGELPVGYFTNRVLSTTNGTSTLLALDFMCWRRSVGGDNSCMRTKPEIGVLSASGDLVHISAEGRSYIIPTKPSLLDSRLVLSDADVRYIR